MDKEIQEITKEINELEGKIDILEKRRKDLNEKLYQEKEVPKLKDRIGKCFKRKQYVGYSGEAEDVYIKILDLMDGKSELYKIFRFCIDKNGQFQIIGTANEFFYGWQPITEEEYNKAKGELLEKVKSHINV